jgi:hypothetical protein
VARALKWKVKRMNEEGKQAILLFADTAVAAENPGWREFSQFVADHVFGDINGDESLTVVDGEVMADEIRGDHRLAAPGFDGLAVGSGGGDDIDLGEKLLIDVRAFLERAGHEIGALVGLSEWQD